MMLEEYIYNVSDDDHLSQKCKSWEWKEIEICYKDWMSYSKNCCLSQRFFFWSYELSSLQ